AEFAAVPLRDGRLDLEAALRLLAARDINEVQVEAGPALCGALLRAGLVDELLLYQAPLLLGDTARPLFAGLGIEVMAQRLRLQLRPVRDWAPATLRPAVAAGQGGQGGRIPAPAWPAANRTKRLQGGVEFPTGGRRRSRQRDRREPASASGHPEGQQIRSNAG